MVDTRPFHTWTGSTQASDAGISAAYVQWHVLSDADWRRQRPTLETRLMLSAAYVGAWPDDDRCTMHTTLNLTRRPTGSQCNWCNTDVMWLHCLAAVMRRVAALSTNCIFLPRLSVLWRCWLDGTKGIRPVKTECEALAWLSVRSEAQMICIVYGPANATATPPSLGPVKPRMVYLSGTGLHKLSWKKAVKRM